RRQSNIIERSTNATEKSVRLQQALQQQWLQLISWRTERRSPVRGTPSQFTVAFEIVNPTSVPLTIERVVAEVAGRKFDFAAHNLLPPQDCIKVDFPIILTQEEMERCA